MESVAPKNQLVSGDSGLCLSITVSCEYSILVCYHITSPVMDEDCLVVPEPILPYSVAWNQTHLTTIKASNAFVLSSTCAFDKVL